MSDPPVLSPTQLRSGPPREIEPEYQFTMKLTGNELRTLQALAVKRRMTIEACLRDFIKYASVGANWGHPAKAKKL